MTKIQFTPKLVLISLISFLVSLVVLIEIWFALNGSMLSTKQKLDKEVKAITSTVSGLKIENQQLSKQKKLVDSVVVKNKPYIPNGMQIGEFLADLERFVAETNMVINTTDYTPTMVYPAAATNDAKVASAQSSLFKLESNFEVSGGSAEDCQKLIDRLENETRYVNVSKIGYASSPKESEYTVSLTFTTYYLSEYDTFKKIS